MSGQFRGRGISSYSLMKIDPQNLTLSELLDRRLFRIPAYQRAYSWKDKQRTELFKDLLTLHRKQHEFHFMATVVGVNRDRQALGTDMYQVVDIVDGQQRLTTLILLLRAIALALPTDDAERNRLESQLIKDDSHTLVLLQTNHDYSNYFIDYLRHGRRPAVADFLTRADANIVAGIASVEAFVPRWLKETGTTVLDLLALVKNQLRFIYHPLDDEGLVYTVFEVLNTRGLEVAWLDRCKAVLMGIAYEEAPNREEMITELQGVWRRIYEKVGLRQGLSSQALRFAATLRSGDATSRVLSDEDALEVFRVAATGQPNETIAISGFIEQVAGALDDLYSDTQKEAVTKIAHARLLAVAIDLKFSGKQRERLLTQWEHVTFRIFGLSGRDSRTRIGDYVRLARTIFHHANGDADYRHYMDRLKQLAGLEFSAKGAAEHLRDTNCYEGWEESLRYFFYARERWLDAQQKRVFSSAAWNKIWQESASRTVEHILPQNPEAGSRWSKLLKKANGAAAPLCHRLGNLVLLPQPLNSQASNADFSTKHEVYRTTGLAITDEIAAYKDWTLTDIDQREEDLIAWAAMYWDDVAP